MARAPEKVYVVPLRVAVTTEPVMTDCDTAAVVRARMDKTVVDFMVGCVNEDMDRCVEVCSSSGSNDCGAFVQMTVVIEMKVEQSAKLLIYVLPMHARSEPFASAKHS